MSDPATPKKPAIPSTPPEGAAKAMSGEERFFADIKKMTWAKDKVDEVVSKASAPARSAIDTVKAFAQDNKWGVITAGVVAAVAVGYAISKSLQRESAPAPTWVDRTAESSPADRSLG